VGQISLPCKAQIAQHMMLSKRSLARSAA